jgi:hypothetical protein
MRIYSVYIHMAALRERILPASCICAVKDVSTASNVYVSKGVVDMLGAYIHE